MTNIALDTNIWIYLTKDTFFELWLKLNEMKESEDIRIIVNDIILKEWSRNKPTITKALISNIKNEYKSALNLANYLSGTKKEEYLQIIKEYNDEENRIQKAFTRIEEVEAFMNSCTIINSTETQKLFIAKLAIEKMPPFQNNKNNFNDALILRNICEYVENTIPSLYDLIYVSNNPEDFINKETKNVHESIFEDLKPIRLRTVRDLGLALQLAPELIENFDDWIEYQLEMHFDYDTIMNR
jgi:predicted nucleic acid-binding protein